MIRVVSSALSVGAEGAVFYSMIVSWYPSDSIIFRRILTASNLLLSMQLLLVHSILLAAQRMSVGVNCLSFFGACDLIMRAKQL